jgi:hypothetical protein
MVFQPGDSGPFWLSEAKREELRLDKVIDGRTTKCKYIKNELTARLQERGITGGGTLKRLQQLCEANQIPIMEETQKVQQGCEGKQKGLLQVLWEHIWIDAMRLNQYTIDGTKDLYGVRQKKQASNF